MTAAPLPPGKLQFVDLTGAPLVGGTVFYAIPGGLEPKDTWQDYDQQILNDNPITLDERGQCVVWGSGRYRQIVKDSLDNEIWDQETFVAGAQAYETAFYWPGSPDASVVIFRFNFTQSVRFPTNFTDSFGSVNSPPSASTVFDVKLNGSSTIGSLTISTGGLMTFATIISNPAFSPGDVLTVQTQGDGANSAAGISATFLGELTA